MPVVLNESDVYREFAPPERARGAIACFWVRRGNGNAVRVLPDSCTDIIWRREVGAVIAGPDTGGRVSRPQPGDLIVGARLLPGAGGAALGVPLTELRDSRVPIDALGVDWRDELTCELDPADAATALARVALRLVAQAPPDPAVQAAVIQLLDPRQRVDGLATSLGFSERQLRRRFLTGVGYGPKTLQRVLRLRRFLSSVGVDGLAGAAAAAGYADQAHLTRDCRALTGLTPGQLAGPGARSGLSRRQQPSAARRPAFRVGSALP